MGNKYDLEIKDNSVQCCPKKRLQLKIGDRGFCLYNDKHELILDASLVLDDGHFKVVRKPYTDSNPVTETWDNDVTSVGGTLRWGFKILESCRE